VGDCQPAVPNDLHAGRRREGVSVENLG
jgi:hypothetical protein